MNVIYEHNKLKELILYVAGRLAGDRFGGATKLNKVLYFSDFAHVRMHGRPITGAEYQKLENGPAPRQLVPVRGELIFEGAAEMRRVHFLGYQQMRIVPLREPDLSVFTAEEIDTVNRVLADLDGLTASQVSELSHEDVGWQLVGYRDTIPYGSAVLRRPRITPEVCARAKRIQADLETAAQ